MKLLQFISENQPLVAATLIWLIGTLMAVRSARRNAFNAGWDAALVAVSEKLYLTARSNNSPRI